MFNDTGIVKSFKRARLKANVWLYRIKFKGLEGWKVNLFIESKTKVNLENVHIRELTIRMVR